MVSMKDIARELGISVGFVSKVLSGRLGTSSVSPRMQKRILKKADDLGYVPNRNAIRLFSGTKETIGVFIHPWGSPGSNLVFDFLHGVTKGLSATDYQTWLNIFEEATEFYGQLTLQQLRQRVDGLLVGGSTQNSWLLPQLARIKKAGVPLVTFFEKARPGIVNICVDYYQQGRLPTQHLLTINCRKIIHIKVLESRYQGYADALREAGLSVKPENVVSCENFGIEAGRMAVRKLLKAKRSFDGVVAQSDQQALGAIQELLAHRIRVPDQVRVTGVDDSPIALMSPIPLTSVTSEAHNMGSLAVECMLKMLARKPVKSMALPPHLVVRSSG
jgi:DNA-binding LacI/PurR family transcriptional regulator